MTTLRILYIMHIYNIKIRGVPMNIIISNSSGQPIYEQIVSQIKNMIISGSLKRGTLFLR